MFRHTLKPSFKQKTVDIILIIVINNIQTVAKSFNEL